LFCADAGEVQDVVLVPIGFLSDHIEVLYDLDTEARDVASQRGLNLFRAESVGCHPRFVRMIHELIVERVTPALPRLARGTFEPGHDVCPLDCCSSGRAEAKVAGRQ
jgi:ferrochelatase